MLRKFLSGLIAGAFAIGQALAVPVGTPSYAPLGFVPLSPANNLSELTNATASRTNLGFDALLPNLSASVQGTGQPGLNGGHWFIWNQPGSWDSQETLRIDRHINSGTGTGGGFVYKGLSALCSTNPANLGFEWCGVFELDNTANASTGAQNVALNGTAVKQVPTNTVATTGASGTGATATITFAGGATIPVGHSVNIAGVTPSGYNGSVKVTASSAGSVSFASVTTGAQTVAGTIVDISVTATWAGNTNCRDIAGEPDPIASCIGLESDVTVGSATTDANKQRVGVQINANGTSGAHVGLGLLMGTGAGLTIDTAAQFNGTYGLGLDFTGATLAGNAVRLGVGQTIAFDSTGTWTLSNVSGTMKIRNASVDKWTLDSSGNMFVPSSFTSSASITASGFLKGAAQFVSGAVPANSGTCAINTQLGGNSAGSFKANGACSSGTIILTLNATVTPANGWSCKASDLTTPANLINQSAYTTATATFSAVTMVAADLITFSCVGF